MHWHHNSQTASLSTNAWCIDTSTLKLLPCWRTRDALTPQLLNCFLVDKHMVHWQHNVYTASLITNTGCIDIKTFKLLPCWQTLDAPTPLLLTWFTVDNHLILEETTSQHLHLALRSSKKFAIVRQRLNGVPTFLWSLDLFPQFTFEILRPAVMKQKILFYISYLVMHFMIVAAIYLQFSTTLNS